MKATTQSSWYGSTSRRKSQLLIFFLPFLQDLQDGAPNFLAIQTLVPVVLLP